VLEYGYDAEGHIVVARRHHHGSRHEDLYFRQGDRVESVRFGIHRVDALSSDTYVAPEVLHEYRYYDGRVMGYRSYAGPNGWAHEQYEYDGDLVVGIEYSAQLPDREERERWVAEYDDLGRLTALREELSGEIVYERSSEPAAELVRRVEKLLLDAVPEVVAGLAPDGPVAFVGLGYDAGVTSPLPPVVGVCTADEHAALFEGNPVEGWNVWAFPHMTADPATAFASLTPDPGAFTAARRALRDGEALRDLVVGVAAKLRRGAWPDDVIVFAVDAELDDLERNLRELLPRER
jgi:hypothetical protein